MPFVVCYRVGCMHARSSHPDDGACNLRGCTCPGFVAQEDAKRLLRPVQAPSGAFVPPPGQTMAGAISNPPGAKVRPLKILPPADEEETPAFEFHKVLRRFLLVRHEDETGVSGTGVIAEGVLFISGMAALAWRTTVSSIGIYQSLDDLMAIHGHNGKTKLAWLDYAVGPDA